MVFGSQCMVTTTRWPPRSVHRACNTMAMSLILGMWRRFCERSAEGWEFRKLQKQAGSAWKKGVACVPILIWDYLFCSEIFMFHAANKKLSKEWGCAEINPSRLNQHTLLPSRSDVLTLQQLNDSQLEVQCQGGVTWSGGFAVATLASPPFFSRQPFVGDCRTVGDCRSLPNEFDSLHIISSTHSKSSPACP